MCLHGPEEMLDVWQKARYIVHAGCAEKSLMTQFLALIKED